MLISLPHIGLSAYPPLFHIPPNQHAYVRFLFPHFGWSLFSGVSSPYFLTPPVLFDYLPVSPLFFLWLCQFSVLCMLSVAINEYYSTPNILVCIWGLLQSLSGSMQLKKIYCRKYIHGYCCKFVLFYFNLKGHCQVPIKKKKKNKSIWSYENKAKYTNHLS